MASNTLRNLPKLKDIVNKLDNIENILRGIDNSMRGNGFNGGNNANGVSANPVAGAVGGNGNNISQYYVQVLDGLRRIEDELRNGNINNAGNGGNNGNGGNAGNGQTQPAKKYEIPDLTGASAFGVILNRGKGAQYRADAASIPVPTDGSKSAEERLKEAAYKKISDVIGDVSGVVSNIGETINKFVDLYYKEIEIGFDLIGNVFESKFKLMSDTVNKSMRTVYGGIFKDNLLTVAHEAYDNLLDLTKESLTARLKISQDIRKYELEYFNVQTQKITAIAGAVGDVGKAVGSFGKGTIAGVAGDAVSGVAKMYSAIINVFRNLSAKEQEIFIKYNEQVKKMTEEIYSTAEEMLKTVKETSRQVSELLMTVDEEARKTGLSMGYSGRNLENFVQKQLLDATNSMISQFGATAQDLVKNQAAYMESSDRNMLLTVEEQAGFLATGKVTGKTSEEIATMVGGMHQYNISAETGNKLLEDMYKTSSRMGVNAGKAVKNFADNLKLASKVNFRDGVNSIKEMTAWSMKTRFNMESIAGMVDKLYSGGLEGVMSSAAKLNVLGGNAALYGDPLGLMYGMLDAQDLAERALKSVSDLGTYDVKTGQTSFNASERLRMRQIAEAYGLSAEELDIMARTEKQRSHVVSQLTGGGFTKEQMDLINANAKFNVKTGKYEVTTLGEKGVSETREIGRLRPEDLKNIINPEDTQKNMVEYAARNLSEATKQTAAQVSIRNMLAYRTYGTMKDTSRRSIDLWKNFFEGNGEDLNKAIENEMMMTVEALDTNLRMTADSLKEGGLYWNSAEMFRSELENLVKSSQDLNVQLLGINKAIKEGNYEEILRILGLADIKELENVRKELGKQQYKEKAEEKYSNKNAVEAAVKGYEKIEEGNRGEAINYLTKAKAIEYGVPWYKRFNYENDEIKKIRSEAYDEVWKAKDSIHDGIVQFHKDDEILAGKKDGGLYAMIEKTYNVINKFPQKPKEVEARYYAYAEKSTERVESDNGKYWGRKKENNVLKLENPSTPYKAEITVKLDSKDGKVDVTNLVRDTDGMRMLTDNILKTIAQKSRGFYHTTDQM